MKVLWLKILCTCLSGLLLAADSAKGSSQHHRIVHHDWKRSEVMDANGLYVLEWWTKPKEIFFRVTVNTVGFIGLGFSPKDGKMAKSDLVLVWVDDRTAKPNALVIFLVCLKNPNRRTDFKTFHYLSYFYLKTFVFMLDYCMAICLQFTSKALLKRNVPIKVSLSSLQ